MAKKLRELTRTPPPMILTRVAQILGGFADIAAQLASMQAVLDATEGGRGSGGGGARGSATGGGSRTLSARSPRPEVLTRVMSKVERAHTLCICGRVQGTTSSHCGMIHWTGRTICHSSCFRPTL